MDKNCSTCKRWNTQLNITQQGFSDCDFDIDNIYFHIEINDDQGLNAFLMTHKDFYCNQYEEKTSEE